MIGRGGLSGGRSGGVVGLKAGFLVLILLGQASRGLAIMADTGGTLVVVANALRLLRSSD